MTTLPLADAARLLGVHPKTLHRWLKEANVPFTAHRTDARIKCVTEEHLQQVARLHSRPFQSSFPAPPVLSQAPASHVSENQLGSSSLACSLAVPSNAQETDLVQKLIRLETKVLTLQEQLAQLALSLVQERSVERRISALESTTTELVGRAAFPASRPDSQATDIVPAQTRTPPAPRPLNPAEQLARSRMPPLIEYSTQGTYVIISSQEGELRLVPDSPAWFGWLATLSSFRFIGPEGRFTAYREAKRGKPTRGWVAHRCLHMHHYKHYLGVTDRLSIDCLERMAVQLQSHLATL